MGAVIEIKCGMHSELPHKTIKISGNTTMKENWWVPTQVVGGISKKLFVITRNYSNQPN